MTGHPIRFGVWALVHGSRAALQDPDEPYDASWERNRKLVLEAEALGFDSTLVAQHTVNPHHAPQDQLEAWTAASALAALTSKIEIIAAIKPYLYHPVVLAKMALGIEHISRGRFAINLVNAWNRPELEKAGIGFPEHDARYDYGREWISVVEPLLRGEALTHKGERFDVDEYMPFGGGGAMHVGALIADVAARPRSGPPLRYGLSAFVIARETEAEAQAHLEHLFALAAKDAPIRAVQHANTDAASVMAATMRKSARVGSNGGTAAGLVGTYDQVAARIRAFHDAGIELYMLQFQPFEADMRRFAAEVMPRVKALG